MFKHSILEIASLFANIVASIISWFMLYNSLDSSDSWYFIPQAILMLGFPFFLISWSLLLWGFQHYLAHCYCFKDYRFTIVLLPLLLALNILSTQDNPNAPTYALWFNIAAFNLLLCLPLVVARLQLSRPVVSSEISKEKRSN